MHVNDDKLVYSTASTARVSAKRLTRNVL